MKTDSFFLGGRAKSAWVQHIINDPRVAIYIARDDSPFTRILAEGKAKVVEGPSII